MCCFTCRLFAQVRPPAQLDCQGCRWHRCPLRRLGAAARLQRARRRLPARALRVRAPLRGQSSSVITSNRSGGGGGGVLDGLMCFEIDVLVCAPAHPSGLRCWWSDPSRAAAVGAACRSLSARSFAATAAAEAAQSAQPSACCWRWRPNGGQHSPRHPLRHRQQHNLSGAIPGHQLAVRGCVCACRAAELRPRSSASARTSARERVSA